MLNKGCLWGRRLNGSFSHLAYVRLMKFLVAPESKRAGASILRCAAWTYALKFMDFLLDMYMLSEVFLSWAAWVKRASASSFSDSSASYEGLLGSGVIDLSSGRSNVTNFVGHVGRLVVGLVLPPSDPLELYRVLLPVESLSW